MQQAAHYARAAERDPDRTPQGRTSTYLCAAHLIADSDPKAAITYELKALQTNSASSLEDYLRTVALLRRVDAAERAAWEGAIDQTTRRRFQGVFTTGHAWRTVEALLGNDTVRAQQFLRMLQGEGPAIRSLDEERFTAQLARIKRAAVQYLTAVGAWHELAIVAASLAGEPDVVAEIVEGALAFSTVEENDHVSRVQELMLLGQYGNAATLISELSPLWEQTLTRSEQVALAARLAALGLYGDAADLLLAASGLDPEWVARQTPAPAAPTPTA